MNGEQWPGAETQDAGELVTLEPVIVGQKHLDRILPALQERAIYYQFGERLPGDRVVLFVMPDDQEHVEHLATMASLPLAGCRWLALSMLAMASIFLIGLGIIIV